MTPFEKKKTTYSVAEVQLKDGTTEIWVASAGKKGYVSPRIKEAAGADRIIKGKLEEGNLDNRLNDAEQTILREAKSSDATINDVGVTRDMCHKCQHAYKEEGAIDKVSTPLKK